MVDQSSGGHDPGVLEAREADALVDMAKAVDVAFPKLKCLRCGSESFYLIGPSRFFKATQHPSFGEFDGEVVDLVCQRCGMIERHLWKILRDAAKPIDTD